MSHRFFGHKPIERLHYNAKYALDDGKTITVVSGTLGRIQNSHVLGHLYKGLSGWLYELWIWNML